MATQFSLNSIGKDMDWTWPYIINFSRTSNFQTTFLNQDWSDIRTAYQNFDSASSGGYFAYDVMHPNGICMYEKLPKVSIAGDERVWIPIDFITVGDSLNGSYLIYYFPTNWNGSTNCDCIVIHIVNGVFDHAVLNVASSGGYPIVK